MESIETINKYLVDYKSTIDNLKINEILALSDLLEKTRIAKKKVFIFGNGGSGSTASHFACDINKGVSLTQKNRHRVIALTDNIPTMLAYANDCGYDSVFVEQLKNFIEVGDVVIGISGSGNSKNVLNAIEYANQLGNITVGLTGFGGGKLKEISKLSVNANVNDMQLSEDIHMMVVHILMKTLSKYE
jgi:D-sedoheptulose 7-phosphate isomerase